MELLESIANDPTVHVEMDFEPGDVQLLNNGRILHAREAYEDADDPAERRHLLRLWLAAHRFTSLEQQLREGISTRPLTGRGRSAAAGRCGGVAATPAGGGVVVGDAAAAVDVDGAALFEQVLEVAAGALHPRLHP